MPYYRKRGRYTKRRYAKRKTYRKPSMTRKALIRTIKAVTKRTTEHKQVSVNMGKVEMYHNSVHSFMLNKTDYMPAQGPQEYARIGDSIDISGWSLRLLIGQKTDRPNVTFKYWVISVPKGSTYTYNSWFQNMTNNVLLDDLQKDVAKLLKVGVWRPNEAGLGNTGGDEYTFTKRLWVPYKRRYKFGPGDNVKTHNDGRDIWLLLAAYDAYGSITGEDNIAYVQSVGTLYFTDP